HDWPVTYRTVNLCGKLGPPLDDRLDGRGHLTPVSCPGRLRCRAWKECGVGVIHPVALVGDPGACQFRAATIPALCRVNTRLRGTGVRGGVLVRGKQRGNAGGRGIAGKMYLVLFAVNCTVSSESLLGDLSGFLAFSQVR